jgi:hypothetical protein
VCVLPDRQIVNDDHYRRDQYPRLSLEIAFEAISNVPVEIVMQGTSCRAGILNNVGGR